MARKIQSGIYLVIFEFYHLYFYFSHKYQTAHAEGESVIMWFDGSTLGSYLNFSEILAWCESYASIGKEKNPTKSYLYMAVFPPLSQY
jgi:hypothetical protein